MASKKTTSPKKISSRRKSLPRTKPAAPVIVTPTPAPVKERKYYNSNKTIPAKYNGVISKYEPDFDPDEILNMFPPKPAIVEKMEFPVAARIAESAVNLDKETLFFKSKIDAFNKIAKKALKEKLLHDKEILTGVKLPVKKTTKTKTTIRKIKDWISNKLFDFIYYLNK